MITEIAKAKINLTLRVLGRRADGYHELVSLVAFADVGDVVTLWPDAGLAFEMDGPFAQAIDGENLIEKTCRLLREMAPQARLGRFQLTKGLPVAAGLGGGSADAAAVLRAFARAEPELARPIDLTALAARLGADVTVCLLQQPALMWGVGEHVEPVAALPNFWVVLVNPGVPLSTAAVFRALAAPAMTAPAQRPAVPQPFADLEACVAFMRQQGNDLQATGQRLCPPIGRVLAALAAVPHCLFSAQSGSGPTCFGVFAKQDHAATAAGQLCVAHPAWWIAAAGVN